MINGLSKIEHTNRLFNIQLFKYVPNIDSCTLYYHHGTHFALLGVDFFPSFGLLFIYFFPFIFAYDVAFSMFLDANAHSPAPRGSLGTPCS